MTAPPGIVPDLSSTARLADKGTTTGADAALMRRTVTALVSITNCRRSEARERINAWQQQREIEALMTERPRQGRERAKHRSGER